MCKVTKFINAEPSFYLATGVARSIVSGQQLRANSSTLENASNSNNSSGFATTKPGPRKMHSTPMSQTTVVPQHATNIATINPSNKKSTNPPIGRGVPPPIPPNKPVIPPKREGSSSRLVTGPANGSKDAAVPPPTATTATGDVNSQSEVAPVME